MVARVAELHSWLIAQPRQDCYADVRTLLGTPGDPRGWRPECVHAEVDSSEAFSHLSLQTRPPLPS